MIHRSSPIHYRLSRNPVSSPPTPKLNQSPLYPLSITSKQKPAGLPAEARSDDWAVLPPRSILPSDKGFLRTSLMHQHCKPCENATSAPSLHFPNPSRHSWMPLLDVLPTHNLYKGFYLYSSMRRMQFLLFPKPLSPNHFICTLLCTILPLPR